MAQNLYVDLRLRYQDGGLRGRLDQVRRGVRALGKDSQAASRQLVAAFGRTERAVRDMERRMVAARRAILGLASAGAALKLGKSVVDAALDIERLERALTVVSGSSAKAAEDLAYVADLSQRLGLDLQTATREFAGLAAAARGTALQGQQTRKIFEAVSQAAVVLGLSTDDVSGAFRAIQQIISKGTVSAEELRQQLGERLPGAFQIAARAMGVTTQELNRMLERGELLATDFLPRFAEALRREFAEGVPAAAASARASFQRLRTALFQLRAEIGRSGLVDALAEGVRALTESISDESFRRAVAGFGRALGEGIRAAVTAVRELGGALELVGKLLLAGAIAKGLAALRAGLAATSAAFVTAANSATVFRIAVKRIAVVGAVLAGIEALQALLLGLDDAGEAAERASAADEARRRQLEAVTEQTREYADTQILAAEALRDLSADEIRAYQDRLDASRRYYEALAELRRGTDDEPAIREELRRREEAARRLRAVLDKRLAAERDFAQRVSEIKRRELETIRDTLAKELRAYEDANARLEELAERRRQVEERFAAARRAIEQGTAEQGPPGILDLATMLSEIRQAGAAGLFDQMLDRAERLREAVVEAFQGGVISRVDALFFVGQAEELAREAMDRMQQEAERAAAKAKATIEDLLAKAEFLKKIEIGYDEEAAVASTESLRRRIQELLDRNPLKLKVDLEGPDQFRARADQILDIEGKAAGGLITGPGTETSDSILARLSRGEYVVRAAAVRRYGLAFLDAINRMRLPRFAGGGLVPSVPRLEPAAAGGAETSVVIVLDGQRYGPMRTSPETADGLREALLRTALKEGARA